MREEETDLMFHYIKVSALVVVLMTVLFLLTATRTSHAASVTATAGVPNGTTNFGGVVEWSLNKPGELPTYFEISWDSNANLSGNDIVTTMDFEVDNAFGFTGSVSGNILTVNNAQGSLGTAPGEVDMTWEVDLMGGTLPPIPELPLLGKPLAKPWPSLAIFIAANDGTSTPVTSAGIIVLQLVLGARDPINATLSFDSSMSTADLNRDLNNVLKGITLPAGISYEGLNNGFPTFTAEDDFNFMVKINTSSNLDPGFDVGFVAFGAIPEPTTFTLAAFALLGLVGFPRHIRRKMQ